jgi:hypothetical protein
MQAIDAGSAEAHPAVAVATEICNSDIVSPYYEDVWFGLR